MIGIQFRLVEDDQDRIVGYIEARDIDNPPVDGWVWGRVHPDYKGRGIGMALMAWARQRAEQAVERCPSDTRVVMRTGSLSTHEPTKALFEDLGMTVAQQRDIYELELRPGVDLSNTG